MKKPYSEEEKRALISFWEKSGQSQSRWCAAQGLNRSTFGRWVSRYTPSSPAPAHETKFIPLEWDRSGMGGFRLHYPGGICLECPAGLSMEELIALLKHSSV